MVYSDKFITKYDKLFTQLRTIEKRKDG